jgi:ribosomal protein S18 acetylase RimI-like enzyme
MNGFEIREFIADDIDAALRLWRRTEGIGLSDADHPDRLREFLLRNPGLSRAAFCGDNLVGTILCGTDGRRGYIHHLAVAAESRRNGVGRALLDAGLFALQRIGIGKCHAFIFQSNPFGERFWVRSGWQRREDLYVFSRMLDLKGTGAPEQ